MKVLVIFNIEKLISFRNNSSRILALDVGSVRVGLSISDRTWTLASPLTTIKNDKKFNSNLVLIIEQFFIKEKTPIVGIVIGLPLMLNGEEAIQAQKVRLFSKKNLEPLEVPLFLWDERLSTKASHAALKSLNVRHHKRLPLIDKVSATFILQGFLNHLNSEFFVIKS